MKKHFTSLMGLAKTKTAKDTAILFFANILSAFLGFLFTVVIARGLSIEDFGIFSAANNLIVMLISFSDLGLSTGLVYYVSKHLAKEEKEKAFEYAKAVLILKVIIFVFLSTIVAVFSKYISNNLIASSDEALSYYIALIILFAIGWTFAPFYLQAKKEFFKSSLIEIVIGLVKLIFPVIFLFVGILTIRTTLLSFGISLIVAGIFGFILTGIDFLKSKPKKETHLELLKYSGWIGLNRIISSISGKLDIQMLAVISGATITGIYSIPSRLSSFIIVISSSFSSVLAPRFSSFSDKESKKKYLLKSLFVSLAISVGIIFWIIIAKPFVVILFGQKYAESVPVFKGLIAAYIPFVLAVPSVTAIIYAMKKTIYIGVFSLFQLAAIYLINQRYIPQIGSFAPVIAYGFVYSILAIYSWIVVIKHYWFTDKE